MVKLLTAFALGSVALGGCAPAFSPGGPTTAETAQATTCTPGLQRHSGRYSGQPGQCYDPYQARHYNAQDGRTYCGTPEPRGC